MRVTELLDALQQATTQRAYIRRSDILEQSINLVKARLVISSELFVQIYRNDRFDTTNFALIHNGQRIYARDQVGGIWHRHNVTHPVQHDTSADGLRPIGLPEFLDEVESILASLGLP